MTLLRTSSICGLVLCSLFISSIAFASESDSIVDNAWKQWNENKRDLVEQSFLSAIQKDPNNTRAHLGLYLLYTLQLEPGKAWDATSRRSKNWKILIPTSMQHGQQRSLSEKFRKRKSGNYRSPEKNGRRHESTRHHAEHGVRRSRFLLWEEK